MKFKARGDRLIVKYLDFNKDQEVDKKSGIILLSQDEKKALVQAKIEGIGDGIKEDLKIGMTILVPRYVGQRIGMKGTEDFELIIVDERDVLVIVEED